MDSKWITEECRLKQEIPTNLTFRLKLFWDMVIKRKAMCVEFAWYSAEELGATSEMTIDVDYVKAWVK